MDNAGAEATGSREPTHRSGGHSGLGITLANPQQRWSLTGLAGAAGGTWLITTALSIYVVAEAGSDGVALLSLRFLAPALAGPFAAVPAMRWARRTALLLVGSGRTVVLGVAALALVAGAPLWVMLEHAREDFLHAVTDLAHARRPAHHGCARGRRDADRRDPAWRDRRRARRCRPARPPGRAQRLTVVQAKRRRPAQAAAPKTRISPPRWASATAMSVPLLLIAPSIASSAGLNGKAAEMTRMMS